MQTTTTASFIAAPTDARFSTFQSAFIIRAKRNGLKDQFFKAVCQHDIVLIFKMKSLVATKKVLHTRSIDKPFTHDIAIAIVREWYLQAFNF